MTLHFCQSYCKISDGKWQDKLTNSVTSEKSVIGTNALYIEGIWTPEILRNAPIFHSVGFTIR